MGLLKGTKTYLIGPIERSDDPNGWRNKITEKLAKWGVKVFDPMIKPHYAPETTTANKNDFLAFLNSHHKTDLAKKDLKEIHNIDTNCKEWEEQKRKASRSFSGMDWIRKVDKRYVYSADFIIAYLPKVFSAGSMEEITIAAQTGKPILMWSDVDEPLPSSWLVPMLCEDMSEIKDVFFISEHELLEYLGKVDNNEVELDPFKWCFLTYFDETVKVKDVRDNYKT